MTAYFFKIFTIPMQAQTARPLEAWQHCQECWWHCQWKPGSIVMKSGSIVRSPMASHGQGHYQESNASHGKGIVMSSMASCGQGHCQESHGIPFLGATSGVTWLPEIQHDTGSPNTIGLMTMPLPMGVCQCPYQISVTPKPASKATFPSYKFNNKPKLAGRSTQTDIPVKTGKQNVSLVKMIF